MFDNASLENPQGRKELAPSDMDQDEKMEMIKSMNDGDVFTVNSKLPKKDDDGNTILYDHKVYFTVKKDGENVSLEVDNVTKVHPNQTAWLNSSVMKEGRFDISRWKNKLNNIIKG